MLFQVYAMNLLHKTYHPPGTMPGTLKEPLSGTYSLSLFNCSGPDFLEAHNLPADTCRTYIENNNITWVHVQGEPSKQALVSLVDSFDIHELYIEDVANVGQRPKLEVLDKQLFLILSLPVNGQEKVNIEQVSLFLGERTLISFCTGDVNPFEAVIERLRTNPSRLRKRKTDYLFYCLIDSVIDYRYPILEQYADNIQNIEDVLLESHNNNVLHQIHSLRRELLLLRRRLWPQREVINQLLRNDDNNLIQSDTLIFLRDCHDHTISVMEILETYHEMTSGLMELHMTTVSQRLNDVMNVLTIIATLFIPPTFIVGLYGMNFSPALGPLSMPELTSQYGYIGVWGIIITMISGMLYYFKRKNWL
ncbi:MAG: magnesium transporter [Paraglaciecola sp.]|jgi:magnesium transporter